MPPGALFKSRNESNILHTHQDSMCNNARLITPITVLHKFVSPEPKWRQWHGRWGCHTMIVSVISANVQVVINHWTRLSTQVATLSSSYLICTHAALLYKGSVIFTNCFSLWWPSNHQWASIFCSTNHFNGRFFGQCSTD